MHTLALSNSTNPKPDRFRGESHRAKIGLRLTSHDTTINDFAISIEELGYVIRPGIRRELCK
jgi:hypothetical protein